jgi:hypothetical protein
MRVSDMRVGCVALALIVAYAAPAGAQPAPDRPTTAPFSPPAGAGEDAVVFKGGGVLRGRLLEVVPGDHASIVLSTGERALVEWSRIERIETVPRGQAPVARPATKVWVHIETARPLVLEGRAPGGPWAAQCASPCDAELPLDRTYRIKGSWVRSSNDFTIDATAGQRVIWKVNAGSTAAFAGGIVLVSVSPVILLFGLLIDLVGAALSANPEAPVEAVGSLVALAGATGIATGIALIVGNTHTSFTQILGPSQPALRPPPPRGDAWLPLPSWHEASSVERTLPPIQSIPLLTRSF